MTHHSTWRPSAYLVTQSGVINYIPRDGGSDDAIRYDDSIRRTAIITEEDVGLFRVTFSDFTNGLGSIDVNVQLMWRQQLATARNLRDGDYLVFEILAEKVGRHLYIHAVTRDYPVRCRVTIDITRIE